MSHPAETISSLVLDSFVRFGCSKCPDFAPTSLHEWDGHFYRNYENCKETYRSAFSFTENVQYVVLYTVR